MKLIDLLYGLMLRSGNDAAVVIAKEIAGSEEEFVKMMNEKAKEIGMTNTTFSNAHGLDEKTKIIQQHVIWQSYLDMLIKIKLIEK